MSAADDTLRPEGVESLLAHVLKDTRKVWTPAELAELLRTSANHIYELLDAGELESFSFTKRRRGFRPDRIHSAGDLFASSPRRACTRIPRRSVIAYLIECADHDLSAEELTLGLAKVAKDLPTSALLTLEKHFAHVRTVRAEQSPK
jgi:hypothetical protein